MVVVAGMPDARGPVALLESRLEDDAEAEAMSPGSDWRVAFREAVLRYIVREGAPIDERASYYNDYHHPDWMGIGAHLNIPAYIRQARTGGGLLASQNRGVDSWMEGTGDGCELDLERMSWTDSSWTAWSGTFAEDERRSGVDAVVWCRCGRVAGVTWRWEGGMAELLRGVTEPGG